ncbi:capsular exopolysaccharide family [Chloroherpeton thalassium ATCC 35110]|uniref:non-specific protein-tyrosine kinase n=1 Tax=Chloroherpeton thalassium (strain ATCC 35110 / GB-78) TaxID=517418 RepID=B3QXQ6_CHLT3|nr:polysaccharide biosynthesis tyrosine autokinase [Chloroherpeton thalassium]ACF14971.1 capsular exopolysaccharide family [Chloroherpeton thalassium ATCC 35110]
MSSFNGNMKDGSYYSKSKTMPFQVEEEDISVLIFNYLRALSRGKWVILITFVATVLISVIYSFRQKDIYEGITSVLVRDNTRQSSVIVNFSVTDRRNLANEIEILKSRTLAEQVAYKLLQIIYRDPIRKTDTLDIIKGAGSAKIARVDVIAARIMGAVSVEQVDKADLLLIKFRSHDPEEAAVVSKAIAESYEERSMKYTRNTARSVRQFLEDQLAQKRRLLYESEERLRRFMEDNRVISLDEEGRRMIQRYSLAMSSAEEAEVMVKMLQSSLKAYEQEIRAMTPKLSNSAVQATIDPYTKLFQEEIAKLEVERDKILTDPASRYNVNVQERLQEYNDKIESYKKRLQQSFERQVKQGLSNVNASEAYQELFKNKLNTELELIEQKSKFEAYKKLAEEYDKAFLKSPGVNVEFGRLERKTKSAQELYLLLEKKYQEALIAEEQVPKMVEVIDWAITPGAPIAPNRKANILVGVVIGLTFGVGIVMLIQFLDKTVYTPEQAERLGPLLATIPMMESFDDDVRDKSGASVKVIEGPDAEYKKIASHLVTHFDPKSSVSEAYRTLRTNILFSGVHDFNGSKKQGLIYIITSSSPKEGKSTTISNLAITIAQGGQKVLLIDTDLRRPIIHSIFGYNKEPGITNYLVGRAQIDDIVRNSPIQNLDIITSGTIPPNPSELIGTQRMKDMLQLFRERYDIVLLDSPPIIAVTDPQVLAKVADGMILVLLSGQTQIELAKRSIDAIRKVNAKIIGFVLNSFDFNNSYGSYYKYYRYYNYYYEPKGKNKNVKQGFLTKIIERLVDKV